MKAHPIFSLPAWRVGPYQMRAVAAARKDFHDKRRKAENDWDNGVVNIDAGLDSESTLRYFVRHLVTAIHYRSGLNDTCDEEAFTHSLASGFVELARGSTDFWVAFQKILSAHLAPDEDWAGTAAGRPPQEAFLMPSTLSYRGRKCTLTWVHHEVCDKKDAYGFYLDNVVELSNNLRGANHPLVALHEVIHFLHDCEGLKDKSKEAEFKRKQVRMLLRFWKENPHFWHWWLNLVRPTPAQLAPAANEPRTLAVA